MFQEIINWIAPLPKKVWTIMLLDCQERHIITCVASNKSDVGNYIRTNPDKFIVFFERLLECDSEYDRIPILLQESNYSNIRDKVTDVFCQLTDEEIVDEFYGYQVNPEHEFKVCIEVSDCLEL
jgi:hypothetical protein